LKCSEASGGKILITGRHSLYTASRNNYVNFNFDLTHLDICHN
jgi:hypothetical protein